MIKDYVKKYRYVLIISVIWWIFSMIAGRMFINKYYAIGMQSVYGYTISQMGQKIAYIVGYIAAIIFEYMICKFFYHVLKGHSRKKSILLYSIPIFLILLGILLTNVSYCKDLMQFYVGDEKNIWDAAVRQYPFIFVYSGELFLICFFMLPCILAPSIVKVIFTAYVFGYIIYRFKEKYNSNSIFVIYLLFFIVWPFREYGVLVHRMHWYAILYIFMAVKIYFDNYRERVHLKDIIFLSVAIAILTIWRREGVYFVFMAPILLIVGYSILNKEKLIINNKFLGKINRNLLILVILFLAELTICIPEIVYEKNRADTLSDGDVVYRAYLVHMMDMDSFNREKNQEELNIINQYVDINQIDRFNTECAEDAYKDSLWEWNTYRDGQYYVMRPENWSYENMKLFNKEVMKLIKNNPLCFLQSRFVAFVKAGNSGDFYNLIFPMLVVIAIGIYMIYAKNWIGLLLDLCVSGHTLITALTMPASYFKYFFEMYVFAYVFGIIVLLEVIQVNAQKGED